MRYLFVSRNVLYCFCSFLWNERFCSLHFFFGSVRSFRICTAVFIKIFVIVYSNFFFLYCNKTVFFWSFLSYTLIHNFVLFGITKMPIQIFFLLQFFPILHGLLLYCHFSFLLSITKIVIVFSVCIICYKLFKSLFLFDIVE